MRHIEPIAAGLALVVTLAGGFATIDARYAKSVDMKRELNEYYARSLKNEILRLELKPASEFSTADKALLQHLRQELQEATK